MGTQFKSGVYCITNTVNGMRYIGSSARNVALRCADHRYHLNKGSHRNSYLQRAWIKYGAANFSFTTLAFCAPDECLKSEQEFIDKFDSAKRSLGYNILEKASNRLGVKMSRETRIRMSAAQSKRMSTLTEMERSQIGVRLRAGRTSMGGPSADTKAKMAAGRLTPQYRKKRSDIALRSWKLRRWIKKHLGKNPSEIDWGIAA